MSPIRTVTTILLAHAILLTPSCLWSEVVRPVFSGKAVPQIVTVYYHERPPYYFQRGNTVEGLVAAPVRQGFVDAAIPFLWKKIPANRQLSMLETTNTPSCAMGWFKTKGREKRFHYSVVVYQDSPTVALARKDNNLVRDGWNLSQLLGHPELTLLRKAGYSYGELIDSKIENVRQYSTTADNLRMLKMLEKRRADYCFMAEEEAWNLLGAHPKLATTLKIIHITDIPQGNERFLICNAQVDFELIDRFNRAIERRRADSQRKHRRDKSFRQTLIKPYRCIPPHFPFFCDSYTKNVDSAI